MPNYTMKQEKKTPTDKRVDKIERPAEWPRPRKDLPGRESAPKQDQKKS